MAVVGNGHRRAAVVLRGAHALHDGWGPLDWRRSYESLLASYIRPRRADGYAVHIYYHTHTSNESETLRRLLQPRAYSEVSTTYQVESGRNALALLPKNFRYDEYLFTRFDLLYKLPVTHWNLSATAFNVPFENADPPTAKFTRGKNMTSYSDVFFVFYAQHVANFSVCLIRNWRRVGGLHLALQANPWYDLGHVHTMRSDRFGSDTDLASRFPDNCNPLYVLWRRRRIKENDVADQLQLRWQNATVSVSAAPESGRHEDIEDARDREIDEGDCISATDVHRI